MTPSRRGFGRNLFSRIFLRKRTLPAALALFASLALPLFGATYYVDFQGGDNQAAGLTPKTAWKHSPGDRNATDIPQATALQPGDTVIFKGGVQYHGEIAWSVAGAEGQPIVLDGNTAGTFGEGRAVLDGARIVDEWKPVTSAEQVLGNPHWREIMYADLEVDLSSNFGHGRFVGHRDAGASHQAPWQRLFLIDGERRLLPVAQSPKPSDPFYPDLPSDFYRTPHQIADTYPHRIYDDDAFTPDGDNVIERRMSSIIQDRVRMRQEDPGWYDGMFVGVHGGNNHVYFARVERYEPAANRLHVPHFQPSTYEQTRYALYNSPRFIEQPGEWCLVPLEDGRTRAFLLPDRLEDGQPVDIGYPVLQTGILLSGEAAHINVRGFLIQRYAGGLGGVATERARGRRPQHITIADCEVRFCSGQSGITLNFSDHVRVENCFVHQNPGWTVGIYVNRTNRYQLLGNRVEKNSGSGIRHYEATHGELRNNAVLDNFGMHASGINLYEGCADIFLEGNYIQNTVAINRNAERLVFRNNVIDGQARSAVAVAIWTSGSVGGRQVRDLHFENNTLVNTDAGIGWATGILAQRRGSPGAPQGLIIRGNILDGLAEDVTGVIENNIHTRAVQMRFRGPGCQVVANPSTLFRDPAAKDYRRKPGGPAMDVGADVPPPRPWSP